MDLSLLEILVVVLNLLFVVLLTRHIRWGWVAGTIGSALFVWSNITQHLYFDSILNSYYVLAGIYGWYAWGGSSVDRAYLRFDGRQLLYLAIGAAPMIFGLGYFASIYLHNSLPYLDAAVTIISFAATWLAARNYIENWLLWLIADPLAIGLYTLKGDKLYVMLFIVYSLLAIHGYYSWKRQTKTDD